jgi:hypothetical protein
LERDQTYAVKEEPAAIGATAAPPAPAAPSAIAGPLRLLAAEPEKPRQLIALHWAAKTLTAIMVAIFLIGGGVWAFRIGMDQRREIWQSTRSIRFKTDITRGFDFGNQAMRFAESRAHLDPLADMLAEQSPKALAKAGREDLIGKPDTATFRRLTNRELYYGIVDFVDETVRDHPEGDYDLDYTPLRLAAITLWVRHAQRVAPQMDNYPGQRTEDTSLGQDEDVAEPILRFNAYCAAAAALAMFALVWLWVTRGVQPTKPSRLARLWRKWRKIPDPPKLMPVVPERWRWTVPHGIFAFMLATGGFWYAYTSLVHFPPRPAPVVWIDEIQSQPGKAYVTVVINAQSQDTQWHIDYGPSLVYSQSTSPQPTDISLDDQRVTATLQPLADGQTVHLRLSASSAGGVTNSDDVTFVNDGQSVTEINQVPRGGILWPTWTVWARLLLLFIAMVASARLLPPVHRAWACGAVAAMLVWLDPLTLIDAHAWPQWDVWILPFFLGATLLASLDCWFWAGMLLGVGCMFKGQLLLGGPILILWPLFGGRWGAVARILIGMALAVECVTWPWVVNSHVGYKWIETAMLAAAVILAASLMRGLLVKNVREGILLPLWGRRGEAVTQSETPLIMTLVLASIAVAALIVATLLVFHGMRDKLALIPYGAMGWFMLLIVVPPWFLRRWSLGVWYIAVFAAAVWISSLAFGGSYSWKTLGFDYGSVKHDQMQMSIRTYSNLSSLLSESYHWDIHDPMGTLGATFTTPGPWRLGNVTAVPSVTRSWAGSFDVKQSTALLYAICLMIASAAAAMHSRRNDPRFLITLVVPWMIFPLVMCQMGDRYPIWSSSISAAMVAVSLDLSLLHVVVAALAFMMVACHLANFDQSRWPQLLDLATKTFPGIAWAMLLVAAIFLVASLVPGKKPGDGI